MCEQNCGNRECGPDPVCKSLVGRVMPHIPAMLMANVRRASAVIALWSIGCEKSCGTCEAGHSCDLNGQCQERL